MVYRNGSAPSKDKRVSTRRLPNDPYIARKAVRDWAKAIRDSQNAICNVPIDESSESLSHQKFSNR
jgi:hypothetical protein